MLVVAVAHEPDVSPALPDSVAFDELVFGDIEVLSIVDRGRQIRALGSGSVVVDSILFEVTTFAIDTAWVAPIVVPLVMDGDTTFTASSPFIIPVSSLVPDTAQDVLDLAPLAGFPKALWPWILAALAVILITAGLIYLSRRKPAEAPVVQAVAVRMNPYDTALGKLKQLESIDLSSEDNIKPFFDDLSEILRSYLGDVLRISTLEETTREIIQDLRSKADPPAKLVPFDTPDDVRGLLELADLVKFADFYPKNERAVGAIESTRETIDTVERHLRFRQQAESNVFEPASTEQGDKGDTAT